MESVLVCINIVLQEDLNFVVHLVVNVEAEGASYHNKLADDSQNIS